MVSDHERGNSENNRHENLPEIPENSESSVSKTHLALDEEEKGEQIRSEQGSIHSQSSIDEIEILPPEPPNPVQLSITKSQSPSSLRSPIPVPPSERRGLLAKFALLAEVKNPYELENKKKWLITLIVALAACAGPMGSSIYYRQFPIIFFIKKSGVLFLDQTLTSRSSTHGHRKSIQYL